MPRFLRARFILALGLGALAFLLRPAVQNGTGAPADQAFTGKVVGITDGDTITVLVGREQRRVRLHGIDCPEQRRLHGIRARRFSGEQAFGKAVMARVGEVDQHGRLVRHIALPDGRKELEAAGDVWPCWSLFEQRVADRSPSAFNLDEIRQVLGIQAHKRRVRLVLRLKVLSYKPPGGFVLFLDDLNNRIETANPGVQVNRSSIVHQPVLTLISVELSLPIMDEGQNVVRGRPYAWVNCDPVAVPLGRFCGDRWIGKRGSGSSVASSCINSQPSRLHRVPGDHYDSQSLEDCNHNLYLVHVTDSIGSHPPDESETLEPATRDCPERAQAFGARARQFTGELAFGKRVTVRVRDTDRYGRTVGEVILSDGRNLGHELVRVGLAWWYRQYARGDSTLERLEAAARAARRGLWAEANPLAPWDFRRRPRRKADTGIPMLTHP